MRRTLFISVLIVLTGITCLAQRHPSGYLKCFEMPDIDMSENTRKGTVKEIYGTSNALTYDISTTQRMVIHTFPDRGKVQRNYSFLYDYTKRCPLWVAYPMNKGFCSSEGSRTNAWCADPAVSENRQPALHKSYCSEGKPYKDRKHSRKPADLLLHQHGSAAQFHIQLRRQLLERTGRSRSSSNPLWQRHLICSDRMHL